MARMNIAQTDAKPVKKVSPLDERVHQLTESVDALLKRLYVLRDDLAPVMSDDPPTTAKPEVEGEEGNDTANILVCLRVINAAVNASHKVVDEIGRRLVV